MDGSMGDRKDAEGPTCPWCSAAAVERATHCASCGASLAQRESLGGVEVPGVTEVDPALAADGERDPLEGVMRVERAMTETARMQSWGHRHGLVDLFVDPYDLPPESRRHIITLPLGPFGFPDATETGEPSAAALEAAKRLDEEERR